VLLIVVALYLSFATSKTVMCAGGWVESTLYPCDLRKFVNGWSYNYYYTMSQTLGQVITDWTNNNGSYSVTRKRELEKWGLSYPSDWSQPNRLWYEDAIWSNDNNNTLLSEWDLTGSGIGRMNRTGVVNFITQQVCTDCKYHFMHTLILCVCVCVCVCVKSMI
jgi:hypothetical protein